jgi:hypothetical protein
MHLLTRLSSPRIEKSTFIDSFQKDCKIKRSSMQQSVRAFGADMDLADSGFYASTIKIKELDPLCSAKSKAGEQK